ncbi:hypothetical protein V5O48_015140, partial [Marasmius crinis-equi]
KWEDKGFIGIKNAHIIRITAARLRARKAKTSFEWVKGHAGIEGNEEADELANAGRQKTAPDLIDMTVPPELHLSGAKLNALTQSLATRAIKESKSTTTAYQEARDRKKTEKHVLKAQKAIRRNTGKPASQNQVWKSVRNKTLSRNIRQFLFMLMHGGYKVGKYWRNIPNYDERAECRHCRKPESIRHILLECNAPGQNEIWSLAKEMWENKNTPWPRLGLGTILSCGHTTFETAEGKPDPGTSRFYQILISESAYLIWKLRNQRVINDEDPATIPEIRNKWLYTMRLRYKTDLLLTNKLRYEQKALPKGLVKSTWHRVVEERDDLPYALLAGRLGV